MKKIFTLMFLFLFLFSSVLAIGVSYPNDLELLRGESGRISFSVQLVKITQKSICTFAMENMASLRLEIDVGNETVFDANSINYVYGTITVPSDAELKIYEGKLRVSCAPQIELQGSGSKITQSMGVPIKVNVVETRTKENLIVPPKPFDWFWVIIISSIVAIIIVSGLSLYVYKKRKPKDYNTQQY